MNNRPGPRTQSDYSELSSSVYSCLDAYKQRLWAVFTCLASASYPRRTPLLTIPRLHDLAFMLWGRKKKAIPWEVVACRVVEPVSMCDEDDEGLFVCPYCAHGEREAHDPTPPVLARFLPHASSKRRYEQNIRFRYRQEQTFPKRVGLRETVADPGDVRVQLQLFLNGRVSTPPRLQPPSPILKSLRPFLVGNLQYSGGLKNTERKYDILVDPHTWRRNPLSSASGHGRLRLSVCWTRTQTSVSPRPSPSIDY
jgi:hypothetical protein